MKNQAWICLAGGALVLAGLASANLRAPMVIWKGPSGAVTTRAQGLKALSERLSFDCDAGACAVTAVYQVQAEAGLTAAFEFLLPTQSPVVARVGSAEVRAPAEPAELTEAELEALGRPNLDQAPLYRARFEAALAPGLNELSLGYEQPLGSEEHDYGYSGQGRFVDRFAYELWPLRQWPMADGFELKLEVRTSRDRPSFWDKRRRRVRSVVCLGKEGPLASSAIEEQPDRISLGFRLGPDFPDRLQCLLGDADLLPGAP